MILIVEDRDNLRELVVANLNDYNLKCIEAKNGVDAFEKYMDYKDNLSLIITDINMPYWSGYDLLDHIRLFELTTDEKIPIIATSGDLNNDKNHYLKRGFNGYLPKPSPIDVILKEIYKHK